MEAVVVKQVFDGNQVGYIFEACDAITKFDDGIVTSVFQRKRLFPKYKKEIIMNIQFHRPA